MQESPGTLQLGLNGLFGLKKATWVEEGAKSRSPTQSDQIRRTVGSSSSNRKICPVRMRRDEDGHVSVGGNGGVKRTLETSEKLVVKSTKRGKEMNQP